MFAFAGFCKTIRENRKNTSFVSVLCIAIRLTKATKYSIRVFQGNMQHRKQHFSFFFCPAKTGILIISKRQELTKQISTKTRSFQFCDYNVDCKEINSAEARHFCRSQMHVICKSQTTLPTSTAYSLSNSSKKFARVIFVALFLIRLK